MRRPLVVLAAGVILFAILASGITGFAVGGFTSAAPAGSDSAAGAAAIAAHFSSATRSPESLLLRFPTPIWDHPQGIAQAQNLLSHTADLRSLAGPLDPNGTVLTVDQLVSLHTELGPARALPPSPANGSVPVALYEAYRSTAQFISPDGRTVQFYAELAAGPAGSQAAINAVPTVRATLASAAAASGASQSGVLGLDAIAYDINHYSTTDLLSIAPVVMLALAVLLALLLRSLVAPLYLVATVAFSYLAALGAASFVFLHLAGDSGINFVIPILLFIFAMALGEDYNILLMTRVREEAHAHELREALVNALGSHRGHDHICGSCSSWYVHSPCAGGQLGSIPPTRIHDCFRRALGHVLRSHLARAFHRGPSWAMELVAVVAVSFCAAGRRHCFAGSRTR